MEPHWISMLTLSVIDLGSSSVRVKPKIIKLVLVASPLSKDWLAQNQNNMCQSEKFWWYFEVQIFYKVEHVLKTNSIICPYLLVKFMWVFPITRSSPVYWHDHLQKSLHFVRYLFCGCVFVKSIMWSHWNKIRNNNFMFSWTVI